MDYWFQKEAKKIHCSVCQSVLGGQLHQKSCLKTFIHLFFHWTNRYWFHACDRHSASNYARTKQETGQTSSLTFWNIQFTEEDLLLFSHKVWVWFFCNPGDCSPPGSSIHTIFQARILEWFAVSFCRGSSWPRDRTHVSFLTDGFFTAEPPGKPSEEKNEK